jgi:hypothetical protein
MIELTEEQHRALSTSAEPVRAIDRVTNTEYVLLRADVFDRVKALLGDETVYTTAEMLDKVMAEDDAKDPYLAQLQARYPEKA